MLVPHLLHIKVEKKNKKKLDYIQLISKYLDLEKGGNEKWGVFMTLFFSMWLAHLALQDCRSWRDSETDRISSEPFDEWELIYSMVY